MEGLPRALNYELSPDLHFDAAAQQILDSGAEASTPTITTLDAWANNDFLKRIGATILNSIQLKHHHLLHENSSVSTMEMDFPSQNHVVLDSTSVDQMQQQLEYDKFMNEVWIGIVFTLILISMVFCICSCFLYHQFRTWKRNYRHNTSGSTQCTIVDIEALKLHPDSEDPVPEYTLVSGLPSYEAALELLQKSPQSQCLIVYPSVFNLFNNKERIQTESTATSSQQQQQQSTSVASEASAAAATMPQTPTQSEATMPLLPTPSPAPTPTSTPTTTTCSAVVKPNFVMMPIVPSYAEVFGSSYKTIDEKKKSKSKDQPMIDKC